MKDDEKGRDARLPLDQRMALQDELDELASGERLLMSLLSVSMMGVVGLFMLVTGVLALAAVTSRGLAVAAVCIGIVGVIAATWAAKGPFAQLRRARAITQDLESMLLPAPPGCGGHRASGPPHF